MARFPKKRGNVEDQIFFTDNLNSKDKDIISAAYKKADGNISDIIGRLLENGLSIKIIWSDYNESFSAIVTPFDKDSPGGGTFYSAFHSDWKKAVVIVDYLLKDRYDYGDWSKDRVKKFDNSW